MSETLPTNTDDDLNIYNLYISNIIEYKQKSDEPYRPNYEKPSNR